MLNKLKKPNDKGFTIIEVMIVLAIAALILLVIFLAVPALQRNARNTQRRSDANHLAGLVNEFIANHGGTLPTVIGTASGNMDITSEHWAIMTTPVTADISAVGAQGTTSTLKVDTGYQCDPTTGTISAGTSARQFSVSYQVETSGANANQCING